jgi:hypothetical protein
MIGLDRSSLVSLTEMSLNLRILSTLPDRPFIAVRPVA